VCCGKGIKHATPSLKAAAATVNGLKMWYRIDRHDVERQININIVKNLLFLPAEFDFCYENGKSLKLAILRECNWYTG
jgi:hypothetical protein